MFIDVPKLTPRITTSLIAVLGQRSVPPDTASTVTPPPPGNPPWLGGDTSLPRHHHTVEAEINGRAGPCRAGLGGSVTIVLQEAQLFVLEHELLGHDLDPVSWRV